MQAVLAARSLEERNPEYGATVRFAIDVPLHLAPAVRDELVDRTAGRATVSDAEGAPPDEGGAEQ